MEPLLLLHVPPHSRPGVQREEQLRHEPLATSNWQSAPDTTCMHLAQSPLLLGPRASSPLERTSQGESDHQDHLDVK